MTSPEFEVLREWWREKFDMVMVPAPLEMPPLREVNHRIPLKEPSKKFRENTPRCPAALQEALATKIDRYVKAGWWYPASSEQACPLLCICKADGSLRTVIDARNRNSNTILDITPMPDMQLIQESVARTKYRSKIDMSDAYEQIHVDPDDIHRTMFSMPHGTYNSNTMQQGDCNAPCTFQHALTWELRGEIGRHLHVWFDDIFTSTSSVENHNKALLWLYNHLKGAKFYISQKKFQPFAPILDILGSCMDEQGIHTQVDKMEKICNW